MYLENTKKRPRINKEKATSQQEEGEKTSAGHLQMENVSDRPSAVALGLQQQQHCLSPAWLSSLPFLI